MYFLRNRSFSSLFFLLLVLMQCSAFIPAVNDLLIMLCALWIRVLSIFKLVKLFWTFLMQSYKSYKSKRGCHIKPNLRSPCEGQKVKSGLKYHRATQNTAKHQCDMSIIVKKKQAELQKQWRLHALYVNIFGQSDGALMHQRVLTMDHVSFPCFNITSYLVATGKLHQSIKLKEKN